MKCAANLLKYDLHQCCAQCDPSRQNCDGLVTCPSCSKWSDVQRKAFYNECFSARYKGEQKAKQPGDSGKQKPKVKKAKSPQVTSTISVPPPSPRVDSSGSLPKTSIVDSIHVSMPVTVTAHSTDCTPTSMIQTITNRNKPVMAQSRLTPSHVSVPHHQLPLVPTQHQVPLWPYQQGQGQIPPQYWSHLPPNYPVPAYHGPYWNFQPPPVPVPPPPPAEPRSVSPNNRGSRKQATGIPPPTKMARLSLGADASRDQAVVLTKDGSSSESDRSYDNLAQFMGSSDHYDMDTTVYPEHYEELFRSMAEPPDTQEATPDLPPRVNLHVLIRSALDQAAAVPIPPSSVPPLTTTSGEPLYTFQQRNAFLSTLLSDTSDWPTPLSATPVKATVRDEILAPNLTPDYASHLPPSPFLHATLIKHNEDLNGILHAKRQSSGAKVTRKDKYDPKDFPVSLKSTLPGAKTSGSLELPPQLPGKVPSSFPFARHKSPHDVKLDLGVLAQIQNFHPSKELQIDDKSIRRWISQTQDNLVLFSRGEWVQLALLRLLQEKSLEEQHVYDLIRADRFEEAKAALPEDDDATLMAYSLMVDSSKDYESLTLRSVSMLADMILVRRDHLLKQLQEVLQTSTNQVLQSALRTSALFSPTLFAEDTAVRFKAAVTKSREASAKVDRLQRNLARSVSRPSSDSKQPRSISGKTFRPPYSNPKPSSSKSKSSSNTDESFKRPRGKGQSQNQARHNQGQKQRGSAFSRGAPHKKQ